MDIITCKTIVSLFSVLSYNISVNIVIADNDYLSLYNYIIL